MLETISAGKQTGVVRERLLRAADDLFYQEGIHVVGIDRILAQAGVAKGSLYDNFKSKDELVRAYLEERAKWLQKRIEDRIAETTEPRDQIVAVFDEFADRVAAEGSYCGRPFIRACAGNGRLNAHVIVLTRELDSRELRDASVHRSAHQRRSIVVNQVNMAKRFAELHTKGNPLVLYNAWDAGSAKAIRQAGAKAIATSSWSVAEAQGYRDGESMPLKLLELIVERIVANVDAPVTVDFETGYMNQPASPHYSGDDDTLADNIQRLINLGIVGVNFEDRVAGETGVYSIDRQARRIAILRRVADEKGVPLFINARTDVFLGKGGDASRAIGDALDRAKAYAAAGASGFFVPGLQDDSLIAKICESVGLPVNVMVMDGVSSNARLTELGVSRISYGPIPYIKMMGALGNEASNVLGV